MIAVAAILGCLLLTLALVGAAWYLFVIAVLAFALILTLMAFEMSVRWPG